MKSNTLVGTICWLFAITIAFFCGWYGHQHSAGDQQAPVKTTSAEDPGRPAMTAKINKAMNGQAAITVTNARGEVAIAAKTGADGETIEGITVYADHKPAMYVIHYANGSVKELQIYAEAEPVYGTGFYEDGQVEFSSQFEKSDTPNPVITEIRQYFDKSGNPTTKERRVKCKT